MGGGDKALLIVAGRSLLARVAGRLRPQCAPLLLNANGDPARFASLRLPIVPDDLPDHPGPLAGILAGLDRLAADHPAIGWMVSAAADTPFLPADLVARLHSARSAAGLPLACARSAGQAHPVIGLWPVSLRGDLRRALERGERRINVWTARHGAAHAVWLAGPSQTGKGSVGRLDPFFNINRPADLIEAEALLARFGEP